MESDREPLGLSRPVPPEITRCLRAANPGFQSGEAGYLENCQRCVAAYELLRRGYAVTVGRTGEKEIDFVCEKRGELLYVQVAYLLASENTVRQEFGAYDDVSDNFPKYVVSLDEFDMSRNGIKHRNIRDFLLAEEWN